MRFQVISKFVLAIVVLILPFALVGCGSTAQGKVVDEIMQHMAAHDVASTYEHMSSVAKSAGITSDSVAAFINDYAVLVDGYKSMAVSNMNIATKDNVATTEMTGTFNYADGSVAQFNALLHKEGETWMVTELNINK